MCFSPKNPREKPQNPTWHLVTRYTDLLDIANSIDLSPKNKFNIALYSNNATSLRANLLNAFKRSSKRLARRCHNDPHGFSTAEEGLNQMNNIHFKISKDWIFWLEIGLCYICHLNYALNHRIPSETASVSSLLTYMTPETSFDPPIPHVSQITSKKTNSKLKWFANESDFLKNSIVDSDSGSDFEDFIFVESEPTKTKNSQNFNAKYRDILSVILNCLNWSMRCYLETHVEFPGTRAIGGWRV